ncbi:isoprenylcysteine carboxylmethyltransferase family protein [Candidatus Bathyarchaeota archaeon]|nr:isoprenylcysteine carboxylmethyltransferase family protein [Candidatus Bathyarchaeota archaeon]
MNRIPRRREDLGAELPRGDQIQVLLLVLFFAVWGFDSFALHFSTILADSIPLVIQLIFAAISIGSGLLLMWLSHESLFGQIRDPPKVLDTGVYARVRHPMYLGTLLTYLGFFLSTLSIISLGLWIIVFFLYDRMATYEENDLIRMFGDTYRNYQRKVPKWFPRITSPKK